MPKVGSQKSKVESQLGGFGGGDISAWRRYRWLEPRETNYLL